MAAQMGGRCRLARSEAFNRRAEVANLCDYIGAQLSAGPGTPRESLSRALSQERLFAAAFPDKVYDNRALRHTMSYLLDLVRRYLAMEEMESAGADYHYYLCRALRRPEALTFHSGPTRRQPFFLRPAGNLIWIKPAACPPPTITMPLMIFLWSCPFPPLYP